MPGLPFSESVKQSLLYRFVRGAYYFRQTMVFKEIRQRWRHSGNRRILHRYLSSTQNPSLQIGSANNQIAGWLNSDYHPHDATQYHLDATEPFDIPDESFDLVFCEHMIEHISFSDGLNMLRECHRILKPGGRMRIATPPLEFLLDRACCPPDN